MYYTFAGFGAVTGIFLLLVFAILQWLHVSAGSFIDWVIAIAIFEWLLLIVTVPWNIHFEAKEVLAQAAESTKKNIAVDREQLQYVTVLVRRSLFAAIALHLFSAIALYALAAAGISAVGYLSFRCCTAVNCTASSYPRLSVFSPAADNYPQPIFVPPRRYCRTPQPLCRVRIYS